MKVKIQYENNNQKTNAMITLISEKCILEGAKKLPGKHSSIIKLMITFEKKVKSPIIHNSPICILTKDFKMHEVKTGRNERRKTKTWQFLLKTSTPLSV